jgi:mRNA-degrading endonuclease toxin of MazEF toxin-antitoxin module
VVSHDGFNRTDAWSSIIVVPISTSARQRRRGPTAVPLPGSESMRKGSVALCHQVTTVDRGKLGERLGLLSEEAMRAVNAGLVAALDLPS